MRIMGVSRLNENTRTGTRVEDVLRSDASMPYRPDDRIHDLRRRIERCQHGAFDALRVAFVFPLVRGIGFYDLVQLGDECIHIVARFVFRRFQHLLDRTEAAVCGQYVSLLRRGRPLFPFERECRFQRVDIPAKMRFLIECHVRGVFGRCPSVRYRAIRIRVSQRNYP